MWIFAGIVILLAFVFLAIGFFLIAGRTMPGAAGFIIRAGLVAVGIALVGLIYLRRRSVFHLNRAMAVEEERRRLLQIDELTGALTRRYFMGELKSRVGTFRDNRSAVLLVIDVDEFKQLNDSFGHHVGDQALATIVELMRRHFADGVIGRLGGDEFAVLVDSDDTAGCVRGAEAFLADLERPRRIGRGETVLSVSIGVAASPSHTTLFSELMVLADLALYESKARGRGRVTLFDPEMLSDERQKNFMERELRAAIMLNQLELHYQPIVNCDGSIFALEALVRWNHGYRGQIMPGEFIPVAERSMLIDSLGEWVFRRACMDLDDFGGASVSVNVSAAQLQRDAFVHMVSRVLEETGTVADRIVIEITETIATSATPDVLERLDALRRMGFRIALDDFGTGHCGFNYLKTLPIDSVKIDRSYIRNLGSDEVAKVFVAALTQIGRALDLVIVAEGVETEMERELARTGGCNRFQGYLIARPMAKAAVLQHFGQTFRAAPGNARKPSTGVGNGVAALVAG